MSTNDRIRAAMDEMFKVEVELIYIVSFDLKGASSEYGPINADLDRAGYSRDTNIGESTIPRNLFAGRRKVEYHSGKKDQGKILEEESISFKKEVVGILEKHAPGKFDKVFLSVSPKDNTVIRII